MSNYNSNPASLEQDAQEAIYLMNNLERLELAAKNKPVADRLYHPSADIVMLMTCRHMIKSLTQGSILQVFTNENGTLYA